MEDQVLVSTIVLASGRKQTHFFLGGGSLGCRYAITDSGDFVKIQHHHERCGSAQQLMGVRSMAFTSQSPRLVRTLLLLFSGGKRLGRVFHLVPTICH